MRFKEHCQGKNCVWNTETENISTAVKYILKLHKKGTKITTKQEKKRRGENQGRPEIN
jgi:hypothetical protein